MAAMSPSHSDSAIGAFYRRLCSRMDMPSANAVAHKLARIVYFMLIRGAEDFVDQGHQRYEEQQHQRSVAALKRRAAALGFEVNPALVEVSGLSCTESVERLVDSAGLPHRRPRRDGISQCCCLLFSQSRTHVRVSAR
jgi:hypothetical protein